MSEGLVSPGSRRLVLLALAFGGLCGCVERFSANPPPIAPESLPPVTSSNAVAALMAPTPTAADAGAVAADSSHALTITLCSSSAQPCPGSDADGGYRVVFGSGRGAVRSRGQAMADLYKELRDRTASGERLDAETRSPGGAGSPAPVGGGASSKATGSKDDPISQCAFQLLDLVDGVGEVTLDVVHGSGSHGCQVSLGRSADGGASRCLVQEPERPHRMGR
jgi:hypothetical protein